MRVTESRNFEKYVNLAYEADPELIRKWHIASGKGLSHCVDRTVADLKMLKTLTFYVVHKGNQFVGYFGSEFGGAYMPTIFILPKFRFQKAEFWSVIEKHLLNPFSAGVFAKNKRCVKFYERMGQEVGRVYTPDGEGVIFSFNKRSH